MLILTIILVLLVVAVLIVGGLKLLDALETDHLAEQLHNHSDLTQTQPITDSGLVNIFATQFQREQEEFYYYLHNQQSQQIFDLAWGKNGIATLQYLAFEQGIPPVNPSLCQTSSYEVKAEQSHEFFQVQLQYRDSRLSLENCSYLYTQAQQNEVMCCKITTHLHGVYQEKDENFYPQYLRLIQHLFHLGWKHYYFQHEVRYAPSERMRILYEKNQWISSDIVLTEPQFIQFYRTEGYFYFYHILSYQDLILKVAIESDGRVEISMYDQAHLIECFEDDIDDTLGKQMTIDAAALKPDADFYAHYVVRAAELRAEREQLARQLGYGIDEGYRDTCLIS